jgi:isoamylase
MMNVSAALRVRLTEGTQLMSHDAPDAIASRSTVRIGVGQPYPLGATWDGLGVNFAIFSEHASAVELCLFDSADPHREVGRIHLPEQTDMVWHGYVRGCAPGQLYGYRAHGAFDPAAGQRFNPNKVLLDPYAKAIGRPLRWDDSVFGYTVGDPAADLSLDERDSAAVAPLAAVVDTAFTWGDDAPPRTPWHQTVIYELHVKGFTNRHPSVASASRGTYAGLASDAVLQYLRDLGVTAIELLPIHYHVTDRHLLERGLQNYWGYNTLGFFAPDPRFASSRFPLDVLREFKMMVRALHRAGIEVILDVVYNHTAEGNHLGPTLSLRGIDNLSYYRTVADDPRYYQDFTGCGNTLNMLNPRVLQLIMDSLRYWVQEMHVDGFRFDLAAALARELYDVNKLSAFFDIIHQDPVLSQVKLIAEPWDIGPGGYQVGNFPVLWTEWNGRYRDSVRRFWRGDGGEVSEIATRLAGSSDLYEHSGRRPYASINFVTSHDGFTLRDLVTYNDKHNEANGEENRDGDDNNLSWNCGTEGPTDDEGVNTLRQRQVRNLLATLFLSQGVPMLCAGDELGRTQRGNNNAYCQDNELSWIDWELDHTDRALLDFCRELVRLRQRHPVFRRRKFFQGRHIRGAGVKDLTWFEPNGREMTDEAWNATFARALMVRLSGGALDELSEDGTPVTDATYLLLLNASDETISFRLPAAELNRVWRPVFDTASEIPPSSPMRRLNRYQLSSRAMALFELSLEVAGARRRSLRPPIAGPV